jgi:phosphoglycerate dehydrogenase-like enzyme
VRDQKITHKRFYQRLQSFLDNNSLLIADTGDSIFSAADLVLPGNAPCINQAFYMSIGYSVPATLGAKLAAPDRRPITIATRCTGVDHIDVAFAKEKGIAVSNVPTYGENTVAEFTFALILTLARRLERFPNVILTPHNAFNTAQAVQRILHTNLDTILRFSEKGEVCNPVN